MIDVHSIVTLSQPRATKALFVTRIFPGDFKTATYGIYIRMRMLLEAVQALVDQIEILFFVDPSVRVTESLRAHTEFELDRLWGIRATVRLVSENPVPAIKGYWNHYVSPSVSFFRNADYSGMAGDNQIRAFEACLAPDISCVVAHRLGAMCPILLSSSVVPPVFFDLDDIEHRKLMRDLLQLPFYLGKLMDYLKAFAVLRGERLAVKRARMTFLCSSSDIAYYSRIVSSDLLVEIPNTVLDTIVPTPVAETESMLFLGSFTYGPNVDAAEFLVTKVWPLVKSLRPNARLIVAGQRPERIPSFHSKHVDVSFTGFVQDLDELYSSIRVVCCPLFSGGGTRIKIIEAAFYGRPVVSTSVGAEGLAFIDNEEIRLADSQADFSKACAELLEDIELACAVGKRARQRALVTYDRNVSMERVRDVIRTGMRVNANTGAAA